MATDYLSALNVGSGLNVTQIVDALVDAERMPKQKKIDQEKSSHCTNFCAWIPKKRAECVPNKHSRR